MTSEAEADIPGGWMTLVRCYLEESLMHTYFEVVLVAWWVIRGGVVVERRVFLF